VSLVGIPAPLLTTEAGAVELYSVFVFRKAGEAAGGAPNTDGHAANAAAADDVGGRNKKRKRSSQEGRPPPHH
jgi:hypothetical protein